MIDLTKSRRVKPSSPADRLPPHAHEAEQALIGCCLTAPVDCIPQIQAVLTPEAFYDLRHRTIWDAVLAFEASQVDIVTVQQKLKDSENLDGIGGIAYLMQCQDACHSTANISAWISEVSEKFTRRRLIATCTDAIGRAYEAQDDDSESLLASVEAAVLAIRPNQRQASGIKALVHQAIDKLEFKYNNPDKLGGLSTNLTDLDRLSDGMHSGELIVIAGFPSTGKTALAVNIAVHCALNKIPAAIFSAEMLPVQLVVRSLCSNGQANYHKLDDHGVSRMVKEAGKLSQAPLYIEPAQGMNVAQMCAIARRLKQKHDIKIVVVDYIQLLSGTGDNREQVISSISKGCKAMALELGVPVLALSQLNDDGKLRESRAIGQDADTIWKLENNGEWQPLMQPIKLQVEKCRDGATGKVELLFRKEFTRFESVSVVGGDE